MIAGGDSVNSELSKPWIERLSRCIDAGAAIDLREVLHGLPPHDSAVAVEVIRSYAAYRASARDLIEFEEFRRALPWLFDSDDVLTAAAQATIETGVLRGQRPAAIADSILRGHPLAGPTVGRLLRSWQAPARGAEGETHGVGFPARLGVDNLDGDPRYEVVSIRGVGPSAVWYNAHDSMGTADAGFPDVVLYVPNDPSRLECMDDRLSDLPHWMDGVGLVPIREAGVTPGGQYYVAFERLEARTWADTICHDNATVAERVRSLRDVAEALERIHSFGLVSGPLGPTCCLIDRDGRGWLGYQAPSLETDRASDEPNYGIESDLAFMPPESLRACMTGPRGNLYEFGALMLWSFTGQLANGPNREAALRFMDGGPRSLPRDFGDMPKPLVRLTEECLAIDPADRPSSARDVRDRLDRWLTLMPVSGDEPRWTHFHLWLRRNRRRVGLAALAGSFAIAGTALAGRSYVRRQSASFESTVSQLQSSHEHEYERVRQDLSNAIVERERAFERIATVRDVLREWQRTILASEGTDPSLTLALLAVIEASDISDESMRVALLHHSVDTAQQQADEIWANGDRTLESGLWQFLAGRLLSHHVDKRAALPYMVRAKECFVSLVPGGDPILGLIDQCIEEIPSD